MKSEHKPDHRPEREPEAPAEGVSLARAGWLALAVVAAVFAVVAIALLVTDGSPHVPFDYGEF